MYFLETCKVQMKKEKKKKRRDLEVGKRWEKSVANTRVSLRNSSLGNNLSGGYVTSPKLSRPRNPGEVSILIN